MQVGIERSCRLGPMTGKAAGYVLDILFPVMPILGVAVSDLDLVVDLAEDLAEDGVSEEQAS